MLRKKLTLLVMLIALFVTLAVAPTRSGACGGTCSGDNCGCGYYAAQCREDCSYGPPEYYFDCLGECRRESIACSKACCWCL